MILNWNYLYVFKADGDRLQRWETNWKHPDFPSLMVTVEYDTTDAPEETLWPDLQHNSNNILTSLNQTKEEIIKANAITNQRTSNNYLQATCVKNVNISIDIDDEDTGILFMNNEMEPLIEYCQV